MNLQEDLQAHVKSQGQWDAIKLVYQALIDVTTAQLTGDTSKGAQARKALDKAFEGVHLATSLTQKLADVPEAATSAASELFKRPPAEFGEQAVHDDLMEQLQNIPNMAELGPWYALHRKRIDTVVTPKLRNALLDAIREKKNELKGD